MSIKTITWVAIAASGVLPAAGFAAEEPRQDDWGLCPVETGLEIRPSAAGLDPGFAALEGDEATLIEHGVSTFAGNVELVRDDNALRTDRLTYDEPNDIVDALGNTRLWSGSMFWQGEHANLNMTKDEAKLERGNYRLTDSRGRGDARLIEHDMQRDVSKLKEVSYTTCPDVDGQPSWKLSAGKLFLDHHEEWGSARNVVLRVKGVPILYTPYISFPLSDRRKTGLLPPTFGSTRDSGFDITTPFYWNIAPNYDATLFPRYLGNRGLMLGAEGRYLRPDFEGLIAGNILPSDDELDDQDRWLVQFRHNQAFDADRGRLVVDFNNVSDKQYLEDFGNSLSVTSTRFLNRYALVTYGRDWWSVRARVNSYQSVDRTLPGSDRPYDYLPQIYYYTSFSQPLRHVNFQIYGETTYFDRTDTVTGGRFHLRPFVSFPFETAGSFFTPRIALDQTWYALDGNEFGDDSLTRTVPNFSIDSGLFLERNLTLGAESYIHTIEPRIYYLYRPDVGQDDIPVFDSSEFDFSFGQLFRDNRYSSIDRLGDQNSVTLALTSRLLNSENGRERLRASVGQVYYFEDRDVVLPEETAFTDPVSELVAEAWAQVTPAWAVGGALQWDPNEDLTQRSAMRLRYRPGGNKLFNFDYRFRRPANVEQTDLSFRWPLNPNWALLGRWNYSVPEGQTLEVFGGLEYEACCWGVRLVGRRYISTSEGEYDNAVFLQVELKGLGGLGRGTSSYLKKNIPGYTNEF